MNSPSTPDPHRWHATARRLRRLQVAQLGVLAFVCVLSAVLVLLVGRAIIAASDDQQRDYGQLRELVDMRAGMLAQEAAAWRTQATGTSPATATFLIEWMKFRTTGQRLASVKAGGETPEAQQARSRVLAGIDAVDGLIQEAFKRPKDTAFIRQTMERTDEMRTDLSSGMDVWVAAATAQAQQATIERRGVTRELLWWAAALIGLLGAVGVVLWSALGRGRSRLVDVLRSSEERFRALVRYSSDTVMIVDGRGTIRYASEPAEDLFGCPVDDLVGAPLHSFVDETDGSRIAMLENMGVVALDAAEPIEWKLRRRDGSVRQVETISSRRIDDPAIGGFVLNTRDVTERAEMERELAHRAFHDVLTDLPNRALFEDRATHALELADRTDTLVAVAVLDLDDFKTVNDSLGHGAGDLLLVEAANRLRATLRVSDTPARLGGDEFAVLVERAASIAEVEVMAERILEALREPVTIAGREFVMRASLGIAVSDQAATAASLLRDADIAMYAAKARRMAGYAVFAPFMAQAASDRLDLMTSLNGALERGELSLAYQPIVDLDGGTLVGAEALMRWTSPQHGVVNPAVFIGIAEDTGLITTLGAWALREATRAGAEWHRTGGAFNVSVNVSTRQLEHPGFVDVVADALDGSGLPPERLTLEITESTVMSDPDGTHRQLTALKALGVRVAIDDFGTGYSSLAYLARLPIDLVKIDRGFVTGLSDGHRDARLASMIVGIGESLGLETVAEGVEDAGQVADLVELGCRLGQGFYFAEPLPAAALAAYAVDHRAEATV